MEGGEEKKKKKNKIGENSIHRWHGNNILSETSWRSEFARFVVGHLKITRNKDDCQNLWQHEQTPPVRSSMAAFNFLKHSLNNGNSYIVTYLDYVNFAVVSDIC